MIAPKMQLLGVTELATKTHRFATTYSRAQLAATNAAALTAKRAILFGAPKSLKNVRRKGATVKLGVGYDVKSFPGRFGSFPVAKVSARPKGLWTIVEKGAKAHQIGLVKSRRGSPESGKLVAFSDGNVRRGPFMHPGRSGNQPFAKGANASRPAVKKAYEASLRASLAAGFGVG